MGAPKVQRTEQPTYRDDENEELVLLRPEMKKSLPPKDESGLLERVTADEGGKVLQFESPKEKKGKGGISDEEATQKMLKESPFLVAQEMLSKLAKIDEDHLVEFLLGMTPYEAMSVEGYVKPKIHERFKYIFEEKRKLFEQQQKEEERRKKWGKTATILDIE